MPEPKKRFIAGAVCPKCSAMDKIVMYRVGDADYRECVACNFSDQMRFKPQNRELETRVNVPVAERGEGLQTVKILDLSKPKPAEK